MTGDRLPGRCDHGETTASTPGDREQLIAAFRKALDETGLVVTTATTNLFGHPMFKDGAFAANEREVRRYALAKVMRNLDLAAELGAQIYVFRGGREGAESGAAKNIRVATPVTGGYGGPVHFDYKTQRTEDDEGVWASAAACMRNYLILGEKVRAFRADPEVQEALHGSRTDDLAVADARARRNLA